MGTNSLFPSGNIPNMEITDDEMPIRIHDDSEIAQKIMSAYEYEIVLNDENDVVDIIIIQTLDKIKLEQETLNLLTPSPEEVEQAEFELKAITLLTEVGLL